MTAQTMTYTGRLVIQNCPACGIVHAIPEGLNRAAHAGGRTRPVYCPLGHSWSYTKTLEAELAEARNDASWLRGRIAEERAEKAHVERRLSATQGVVTRTRKRIAAGVCPCCHRTFVTLASHMKKQHPDYAERELP